MSYLDGLIDQYCPKGVRFLLLKQVCIIRNGKDHKSLNVGTIPVFGSGGIMRYVDSHIYSEESVLIPRKGSISNIFYVNEPFWVVDTIFYTEINKDLVIPKFLYYILMSMELEKLNIAGGVPSLTKFALDNISIPVPPLPVQEEIVRILDKFTAVVAELEAELEARIIQYEHYRNELLNPYGGGITVTIAEIGDVKMCRRILKEQTKAQGDVPFYKIGTFGKKADAYINQETYEEYRKKFPFPKIGEILISAAGTIGKIVEYDGKPAYYQDSNIVWIDNDESKVLNRFLYHFFSLGKWSASVGGTIQRLYNSDILKTKIVLPTLDEQRRIISILDRFELLIADLKSGLPAEIATRHIQYDFYRDKLLAFEYTYQNLSSYIP